MASDPVIAIGDLHLPWARKQHLERVYRIIEATKPKHIVQLGDLYDRFAQRKFAGTVSLMTPAQEVDKGRYMAERFWNKIREIAPKASLYQLRGNHDERPLKRLLDKAPELEPFFDDKDFYRFQGVHTVFDPREPLIIDDIGYIHGWGKLGSHMRYFMRSICRAHSHTGAVVYMRLHRKTIWEMDAGFLGDHTAVPMRYTPTVVSRWTPGVGKVIGGAPQFVQF